MRTLWALDPLVLLFLAFLAVLTIAFFWPGNGDQRGGAPGGHSPRGGRGPGSLGRPWDVPPGRFPPARGERHRWAVRELETACAAEYASRFAPAIRRVRVF
jgi:hypothetical protein